MGKEHQTKSGKCKTCSKPIDQKSAIYHCVACGENMHLNPKCTGMSEGAIIGISSIINNVLLVCQSCVDLKRKDIIIDQIAQCRTEQPISEIKTEIEELRAEIKVNTLSIKTEIGQLKTSYAQKTAMLPSNAQKTPLTKPVDKQQYEGIRLRGIPEMNSKSSRERYENDLKEVKAIMKHLKVHGNVTDLKRLGKYTEGKNRTLVAKLDSDYAKRLILLSLRKMKEYDKQVFISKELTPDEQTKENNLLLKRRKLIGLGTSAKELRIRNLVLQKLIDKKWVDIDANENDTNTTENE